MRRWATAAALGYVLLVPLQAAAGWQGISQALAAEKQEAQAITRQFARLREAIGTASSGRELHRRLAPLQGPALSDADLARPLPEVRSRLLAGIDAAENRLRQRQREGQQLGRTLEVVQNTVRLCLSAALLGLAFAAAAPARDGKRSLLESWMVSVSRTTRRFRVQRRKENPAGPDAEYFEELSRREGGGGPR